MQGIQPEVEVSTATFIRLTLRFTVAGKPKGKGRPRFGNGHAYTPPETIAYEEEIGWAARQAGATPLPHALEMTVDAYYEIPRSWPAKKKNLAATGQIRPGKPDADNVLKIYADALNKVAYNDDVQIWKATVTKQYGEPRVDVTLDYSENTCPDVTCGSGKTAQVFYPKETPSSPLSLPSFQHEDDARL